MSDFRARSNAELLDAAFEIYRRHFAIFLSVGVVGVLPMAIMQYTAISMMGGTATTAIGSLSTAAIAGMQSMMLLAYLVMLFITPFTEGATVTASARAYRGEPVELADAIRAAFARPVALLLAYWARFFMMIAGIIVVAIAGGILVGIAMVVSKVFGAIMMFPFVIALFAVMILIWKNYFAVIPALLVEEKRVADALSRSKSLAEGNGWRIVLLLGVVLLVVMVFAMMLGALARALVSGVLGAIVYLFAAALVSQFSGVVLTLLYFDLRIRKEGYDIELLTRSLDAPSVPLPPDAPPPTFPATA